ncbi:MAG: Qat anti-phage system QueC-like protein QatC [Acinetobacter sp.]
MRIKCIPKDQIPVQLEDDTVYFSLYSSVPRASNHLGHIAPGWFRFLRHERIKPSIAALDFATLAFAAVAADESVSRRSSADGWTRTFDLTVALINPEPWSPILNEIQNTLHFLSGDYWNITVVAGGHEPQFMYASKTVEADCVCLLSGGTDSLIGAIDLIAQGHSPILVSRTVRGDCAAQRTIAQNLCASSKHYQWGCTINKPYGMSEPSTRARSLVFFAFAVAVASIFPLAEKPVPIIVPENGFISISIPLSSSRIGSLSTKTTHPVYMNGIQHIINSIGINAQLELPYRFKTKGEMIVECQNPELLKNLINTSISCGKYRRHKYTHCGVCVPCLVRRAAYLHANIIDETVRGYELTPSQYVIPEDTMAAACAVLRFREYGVRDLTSGLLTFASLDERLAYEYVFKRGLMEIEQLLEEYDVI